MKSGRGSFKTASVQPSAWIQLSLWVRFTVRMGSRGRVGRHENLAVWFKVQEKFELWKAGFLNSEPPAEEKYFVIVQDALKAPQEAARSCSLWV